MSTPAETAERLVAALEELATEEAILVRERDYDRLPSVQERARAIAQRLVTFASDPSTSFLRPRILAVVEQRQRGAALLRGELAQRSTAAPQPSRQPRGRNTFPVDIGRDGSKGTAPRLRGVA